jgi:hypothetical protein
MAYVYPNIQHTAATYPSGTASFFFDFVAWLVNDQTNPGVAGQAWLTTQGGTGGPGWSIIEAYGQNSSGNQCRGVPSIASGNGAIASFTTGTGLDNTGGPGALVTPWPSPTPAGFAVGDWIVLQSAGTNPFQLYIEYASTTTLEFKLLPLASKGGSDDWTLAAVAGDVTAPPPVANFPTTSVPAGQSLTFRSVPTFAATAKYSGVSDDRMFAFIDDDGSNPAFIYIGDLEGAAPEDPYPYVIRNENSICAHRINFTNDGDTNWDRLSPVDELTLLTAGVNSTPSTPNKYESGTVGSFYDNIDPGANISQESLGPVGVRFNDTGHLHYAGRLKHVFISSDQFGTDGTINDPYATGTGDFVGPNSPGIRNYIWRFDLTGLAGAVVLSWDGFTLYP